MQARNPDVLIVGSGMGGATLAYALRASGRRVRILERGGRLPSEPANWDPAAVFGGRYMTTEVWTDRDGRRFSPETCYVVGGNTKVFGATLARFRARDLERTVHADGVSPAWPIRYDDLAPYYTEAERLFGVRGTRGEDPTEPSADTPYVAPAIAHEQPIQRVHDRLQRASMHPYHLPMAVDAGFGGTCVLCATCDAFPCRIGAKFDAEKAALGPALASSNVELWTGTRVVRLVTDRAGRRIVAAEVDRDGRRERIAAGTFVLAAGAVNSAMLLLASANDRHPRGLANGSDQVGRNYMAHINTVMMSIDPLNENPTRFQKTLGFNDFYDGDDRFPFPMGNIQLLGKITPEMIEKETRFLPSRVVRWLTGHSVDWWVMSEDLPDPENRVTIGPGGTPRVSWLPVGMTSHRQLVRRARRAFRDAGFPIVLAKTMGVEAVAHQCGTVRAGDDPSSSVLDRWCRAHEVENLHVVDASHFPSSAAMNPALTVAAQALRVGRHLASQG